MTKKELFTKAHQMTREIKAAYTNVDYKFQLGLCLSYLQEGAVEMVELKGSEKQIKWAESIREEQLSIIESNIKSETERRERMVEQGRKTGISDKRIALCKEAKENLEKQDKATFWIENQNIARGIDRKDSEYSKMFM